MHHQQHNRPWAFAHRSILIIALLLNWQLSASAAVTLTNNSLSAFTSALANGGLINLAFNGTITATSTFQVNSNTMLNAAGFNVTFSGANSTRVFTVATNVNFSATNLTIAFGKAAGANGAAGSNGSSGSNGSAGGNGGIGQGGGVMNGGQGTFIGCTFLTNSASGGNGGNGGSSSSSNGSGGNGGSGGSALGGAIYNYGTLFLTNCTFAANGLTAGNGGIGGSPGTGTGFAGSTGVGGSGGMADGGAVYSVSNGLCTVYGCTFITNTVLGGNSQTNPVVQNNGDGGNGFAGGSGQGGAIANLATNTIINSTFYANRATGGTGGAGGPAGSGFYGGNGGNGGNGLGGNMYCAGLTRITNCTLDGGSVAGGAGGPAGSGSFAASAGSAGTASGANIYNASGTFNLKNSILAGPVNDSNGAGTITDQGNNISSDGTPAFTQTNSFHNTNAELAVLGNYGGPTLTFALQASSPAIGLADTNAAPPQDQRGYWWTGYASSGAYDYGATPSPAIDLYTLGPSASEDGDVGMFFLTRTVAGGPGPVTINYTISGTATNGVNYVTIPASITLPAGVFSTQVLVQAISSSFSGVNLSVTLTLSANTQYQLDPNNDVGTVLLYPQSTIDPNARFVRGTSTAPDFQSFLIPLDSQTGVPLAATGGNAATLFPGNPWTTNFYHYNGASLTSQTGTNGRIVFQNPIVAFGSPVGGSPLYLNQNYDFGVSAGTISLNLSNALRIQVYYRSNSAYAGTIALPILNPNNAGQLATLVTNGFTQTFANFGLQTTILESDFADWGLVFGNYFVLTHTATAAATNYYYVVEEQGYGPIDWLVRNQSGNPDWSKLYVMEFTPFPAGRSTFVDQPQFNGIPLPPTYQGMSLQELTNVAPSLPNLSALVPTNYLKIDSSPELRRHPILDSFVANMNNDPLALANYVINEIDLTDAIDYDANFNSQPAINLGGVDRGALATFQESQGSPAEQCALLIYLLRQAGVPAAYVYPATNGLQMLDFQVSKLLRVQLHGALSQIGQTNLPQLISVNYPWVAAYIGSNWVQIFPWMKDTSIIEGLDLYDYMPTNYNSGYKWLTHFIAGDPNIFSLSNTSDQPLDLLPLFIQENLDANFPGVSVDDLGVQIVNRRHLYSQWSQFPLPFALSGTPTVIESLSTNLNLFNTLDILVYSKAVTNNYIDTGEIPVLYFHDRKCLLSFTNVSANTHSMSLFMSPYSTNITTKVFFGPVLGTNIDLANELIGLPNANLTTNDDNIIFQVTHRRNKFLAANYVGAGSDSSTNLWNYSYFEQGQVGNSQTYVTTNTFRKGDWIAFCLDTGRVSQNMLNVWAQDIWQNGQNQDPKVYVGTTAYLMGMSYFNYCDRFNAFNNPLHKVQLESSFQYGFGLIRPERTSGGLLVTNGLVIPITPALHMPDNGQALIFNNSLRPDQGRDFFSTTLDWWLQRNVQASAAEHGILQAYCRTNAVSAVKLLQQAGTNTVTLNLLNYQAAATNLYHGVQLQNADTNLWASVVAFFNTSDYDRLAYLTPGVMTNGTYVGMGGILLSQNVFDSPVGGLNGGYADNYPPGTFVQANSDNVTVTPAPDDATAPYTLSTTAPTNNPAAPVDGATTQSTLPATDAALSNGTQAADPNLQQADTNLAMLFGITNSPGAGYGKMYDQGAFNTTVPNNADPQQRASDPVNVMTGEFYIDSPDLTLAGPMPLQIRRNYGSQNQVENEFGFGWKMSCMPYLSLNTNGTLIYAAEMDGSVIAYRQTNSNFNIWVPTLADNPTLNNNSGAGIGSVANAFNNILRLSTATGTNVYQLTGADGSVRTFTQRSYPIGSFTRQRPYLDTWFDNRGNSYTCQYGNNSSLPDYGQLNRIQSSNGNFLGFYYDVYGHIIQAYTGDGRFVEYEYDKFGDLVSVTLPDESQINYQYQHLNQVTNSVTNLYSTHLIIEEDRPNGRVLQNAYDSQRRVTNQLATVGTDLVPLRNATFAYTNNFSLSSPTNLLTGATGIYDYTNHLTTYFYTNSLIRKIVDPLSQTIVQNWFESDTNGGYRRSLQSRIDKRGLQTTYHYDTFGNVTNTTLTGDLLGAGNTNDVAVTGAAYNTNNLPLAIVDPVGNQVQFIYDATYPFLPQQIIQLAGTSPVTTNFSVYTNASTVVTVGTNVSTNLAFGLLTRTIRAYGSADAATNDAFFNGQGLITSTIQYTGTSDPNVTNQFLYNERNELVQRTDAAGRSYVFFYDPMGRPAGQETYEAGATTPMDFNYAYYNKNGDLTWTDGPRYNPEDYIWRDYDGAGRKITEIHWRSRGKQDGSGVEAETGDDLYATTFYQFDPFGNLIQTIDPLGNYVVQTFDAIGQMTRKVFYSSNGVAMATNGFAYEPGGMLSSITNALGGVTVKQYTQTGRLKFQQNPDGSTNMWRFDLAGRPVQEFLRNGNFWQTLYDDAHLKISKVFSNATSALATNLAQLDHRGNVAQTADPLGNVSTNLFDGLDRIKIAAGPIILTVFNIGTPPPENTGTNITQQVIGYAYDASGQTLTVTNSLGEKTVRTSDALGRATQVAIYPSNSGTAVRVTSTFYRPDHQSVTVTNGTGTNAIITTTYTDNDGHPLLTIGYPTNGVMEFTWWQYDLAGNRIAQQQCSSNGGVITTWATNGWTYDALNRVVIETSKDGASTTNSYDALDDIVNRAMPGGLSWSATYLNDGRVATEQETGGGLTARSMTYTYYPSATPFVGKLKTVTDGRGTTRTNSYDDFLRLSTVNSAGSSAQQQTSTTYKYDLRNLLTNAFQSFNTNTTGPSTTVTRGFDGYGRIASETISVGSATLSTVGQGWDLAGRRSSLSLYLGTTVGFAYQADGSMTAAGEASFGYGNNGLLTSRTNSSRTYAVNQRDGTGRLLQATTAAGLLTLLTENLSWLNNGQLSSYTAARSDFTDSRNYGYSTLARRLAQESFNVTAGQKLTNNYAVDEGQTGGLGTLTFAIQSGAASASWTVPSSGGLDGLSRVAQAQDSVISRSTYGTAVGAGSVSAALDGKPVNVQFDGSRGSGQWRANMELAPGSHSLLVSAVDPSGLYFGAATNTFTSATNSGDTIQNTYDGNGNITQRFWINTLGQTNRTQTLTWDALDRLISVVDRDAQTNGLDWSAVYDAFGRRLQTTSALVVSNAEVENLSSSNGVSVVQSWYDPQVEFLEVGVTVNGFFTLKTYGPDASGIYGGMQGMGGLETVLEHGQRVSTAVVQDFFGNTLAAVQAGTVTWTPARFSGYGPVAGYQSPSLSLNVSLAQSLGWRGKRVDETGLIYLGARHYDPVAGRFLSADPLGHGASLDLYSYAGGDPVNFFDADGRFFEKVTDFSGNTIAGFANVIDPIPVQLRASVPDPNTWAGYYGRKFGEDLGLGVSITEMYLGMLGIGGGGTIAGGGAAVELGTLGAATPVAVPAMVAGGALATLGAAATTSGAVGVNNFWNMQTQPPAGGADPNSPAGQGSSTGQGSTPAQTQTPATGPYTPRISPGGLPPDEEQAVINTLQNIDAGTIPTGSTARRWGVPFNNNEGNLPGTPGAGGYLEYRVAPPTRTAGAGVRRIVVSQNDGSVYYTWTHYGDTGDPAFVQIR